MKLDTLLVTAHGSHLYGLAHASSDVDFFVVVRGSGKQRVIMKGGFDICIVPFDRFMENVFTGSHQSCEALFSPSKWVDPEYAALFAGWRVTGEDAFAKYRRTIHKFSYGTPKQRRHAVRLGFNLRDLRTHGTFNPVMTPGQITMATAVSELYEGQSLTDIAINL